MIDPHPTTDPAPTVAGGDPTGITGPETERRSTADATDRLPPSLPRPLAFVLPGGASLGAVQVGMITALHRAGIRPDLIIGTSIGSINAVAYAGDPTDAGVERLDEGWRTTHRRNIFAIRPVALVIGLARRRGHLIGHEALRHWLERYTPVERLEQSEIPVHVMCTDADARVPVMLSEGDAITALLASCAIPGVFPPVTIDSRRLTDGGAVADHPIPQAIALGARSVLELSTFGRHPDGKRSLRTTVLEKIDQLFGKPPDPTNTSEAWRSMDRAALGLEPGVGAGPADGSGRSSDDPVPVVDVTDHRPHDLRGSEPDASAQPEVVPDPVVHVIPAPATTDVNPFTFHHSARLIDAADELTTRWIAEHL